ncbi:MAG: NAD-dependent epimerase/dehydratase family protein [Planctomycetes bacterium]|nr:NAD-dependent epimerase/dehydratase family protein [Planctomycetota bacterium]
MEVACTVRPGSDTRWLAGLGSSACGGRAGVELRIAPLEEPAALRSAVADAELVFHVAGTTRARNRRGYFAVNADGTRRLVEAVLAAGGSVRRFVYISSLAATGPADTDEPPDEMHPPSPIDDYGLSKLAGERVVLAAAADLPVTIVRPPAVYGPRDRNFLPLFRLAARWGVIPAVGPPGKLADFVHAADLAEGIRLAGLSERAAGRTYFISGGTSSMAELADALGEAIGRPLRRVRVPAAAAMLIGAAGDLAWLLTGRSHIVSRRKVRDMLQPRWICSWRRAKEELGYRPRLSLRDGLDQTARWYAEHGLLD